MTTPGARRLAQAMHDLATAPKDKPLGRVTAIAAGVTRVRHDGADLWMPHLASYTPVVGDQVALDRVGGRWVVLGLPAGIPT